MGFNPKAKYPYVEPKDFHTLIDNHIEDALLVLRDNVSPREPYDDITSMSAVVDDLLVHFDLRVKNIPSRRKCNGYFSINNRTIYIRKEHNDRGKLKFYHIFMHELGHMIQYKLGLFELYYGDNLLSAVFRMEQECEAIAEWLFGAYFGIKYRPAYTDIGDARYLKKYYGNWYHNDLVSRRKPVKRRVAIVTNK